MSLGNGNPKEGDKGSNFNYELKVLQGLDAIATGLEQRGGKGLFAETANSTPITNTLTPSSLLGAGVGVLTVPANGFNVGDSFHLKMLGHLGAKNGSGLRIIIASDGVTLASTAGYIPLPNITNRHWELNVYFTIRAVGAATVASISSGGVFMYTQNASTAFNGTNFTEVNNTTFDTTIDNTLEVIAIWDTADPLNNIYSEVAVLQKIY
jgi:hypothetical protein